MDVFDKCREFKYAKQLMEKGYYPYFSRMESAQGPEVMIDGKMMIMLGSNNYLGLVNDPRMCLASNEATHKYGTGCAGSRFLNGTTDLHMNLEKKLAEFKCHEAALIYATGYQANLGVISCLIGKKDVAIMDKLDHASIFDGADLSPSQVRRFKHNNIDDLVNVMESIGSEYGKIIITDGIFSMEGDICRLPEIVDVAKRYNARIMVDDAHATGVLGENGRGTCEHYGLENGEVDIVMGTCSKSFASVGGFVAASEEVIHYVKHKSRSMIFSAALPPSCVAAISTAIDIIRAEPERRQKLWENTKKMREGFKAMGFNVGSTETPIVPIILGDNDKVFSIWKLLYENNIFTNPVIRPAVPPGKALIRTTYMTTHTDEQLDHALEVFEYCGKKLGLLNAYAQKA